MAPGETMTRYTVHALDVWGNAEDGYEVNDVYPSRGTIELPADATDAQIVAALQAAHFASRADIDLSLVEIDGEPGYTLYLSYDGRPEFELRKVETK